MFFQYQRPFVNPRVHSQLERMVIPGLLRRRHSNVQVHCVLDNFKGATISLTPHDLLSSSSYLSDFKTQPHVPYADAVCTNLWHRHSLRAPPISHPGLRSHIGDICTLLPLNITINPPIDLSIIPRRPRLWEFVVLRVPFIVLLILHDRSTS